MSTEKQVQRGFARKIIGRIAGHVMRAYQCEILHRAEDAQAKAENIIIDMVAEHVRDLETKCKRYEAEAMALRAMIVANDERAEAWSLCQRLVAEHDAEDTTSPAPAPPPPAAARPPSTPACASTDDGADARTNGGASASGETR